MKITGLVLVILLMMAAACSPEQSVTPGEAAPERTEPAAPAEPPAAITEGLQTPESVLHDEEQDVYFISNINGAPLEADGNGFISRVTAEGMQVDLKWIDGESDAVELDAPKGMGIVGDELWVTDITRVRRFDRRTGAPRGEIPLPGTTFVNDLAAAGNVAWVSDTGMRAGGDDFVPSGTDAIYRIDAEGTVRQIATGDTLNRPNGVAVNGDQVWVVTFGSNELYRLENGDKQDVTTLPQGSLDGLVRLADGTMLVSSWDAGAVFRGRTGAEFQPLVENLDAPADIGYDTKRNLLLIPHFNENRVSFHRVE